MAYAHSRGDHPPRPQALQRRRQPLRRDPGHRLGPGQGDRRAERLVGRRPARHRSQPQPSPRSAASSARPTSCRPSRPRAPCWTSGRTSTRWGPSCTTCSPASSPTRAQPAPAVLALVRRTRPAPLRVRAPGGVQRSGGHRAQGDGPGGRRPLRATPASWPRTCAAYLDGQLVRARQYPPAVLVVRWLRRHRTAVTFAALLLAAVAVASVVAVRRVLAERNAAVVARQAVESRENALTLLQAQRSLPDEPTAVLAWLKRHRPDPEQAWLARRHRRRGGRAGRRPARASSFPWPRPRWRSPARKA